MAAMLLKALAACAARAPMAAGVETSRNSQPKTNAAASP